MAHFDAGAATAQLTSHTVAHLPALDGLRGCAVLAVVAFHSGWLSAGYFGVDIFFTLSGFLITRLLLTEWHSRGRISLTRFYIRRGLRLMPALLTVVAACWAYEALLGPYPDAPSMAMRAIYALTYVSNWIWAIHAPSNPLGSLNAVWSLAIEEQFYLVWPPALVWLLRRPLPFRRLCCVLGAALVLTIATRLWLWHSGATVWRVYAATDSHADPILIGCLLGTLLFFLSGTTPVALERWIRWAAGLSAVVLVTIMVRLRFPTHALFHGGFTAAAGLSAVVITAVVTTPSSFVVSLLRFGALRWCGRLSYGIYLWHSSVNLYMANDFPSVPVVARVIVGFVLASLSYYLIEAPCLKLKTRFSGAQAA